MGLQLLLIFISGFALGIIVVLTAENIKKAKKH